MTTSVRWSGAWDSPAAKRSDYAPPITDRGLREGQRLRLSPGQSRNLSETKVVYLTQSVSTTRVTVLTPSTGTRVRLLRIHLIQQQNAAGLVQHEFYFGTGANITTTVANAIDEYALTTSGAEVVQTWTRGEGPLGAKDAVLSYRTSTSAFGGNMYLIVEYSEEK